eukprot:7595383-Pyramimonas_sp.AAC.1
MADSVASSRLFVSPLLKGLPAMYVSLAGGALSLGQESGKAWHHLSRHATWCNYSCFSEEQ